MQIKLKSIIGIILIALVYIAYLIPPLNAADRIGNQWLFLSLSTIVATLYLYVYSSYDKVITIKRDFVFLTFLGFISFTFLSVFVADNKTEGITVFIHYLTLFLSYIVLKILSFEDFHYKKTILFILLIFFLIDIISSLVPILSDIQNKTLSPRSINYIGLLSNVNITSFVLLYKLPFLVYGIYRVNSNILRAFLYFLSFIAFNILFILGSRASIIGILILLLGILFLAISFKEKRKNFAKIFSYTFGILILSILTNKKLISNEYNVIDRASTISVSTEDGSVNERLNFYKHSINMFLDSPLLGIGTGNWKIDSINYHKDNIQQYIVPFFAHNDFLQVLAESGIFSFLFYISIFIVPFICFFKHKTVFNGVILIFIGIYLIDSSLNFPLGRVANAIHFIFVLTLLDTNKNE